MQTLLDAAPVRIGEHVDGRFTIESLAGSGGVGEVYRAIDGETDAPIAIKVLRGATPGDRARFENEARALADLRHDAIVRYVAHGYTDTGAPYLAMEWLAGEDLAARLARARCSVAEAIELVRRAAEGLAVLHARGMVHRDLKPSNLFLVDGRIDRLKLIDFGLVRAPQQRMTVAGALVGTPGYIAPEQAHGVVEVTPAADVFSLGCVLFEALTGRHAFQGDNLIALLVKLILDEPPDLGEGCRHATPGLATLLRRMLAKRPEDRPRDAAALLHELAELELGADADQPETGAPTPAALTGSERRVLSLVLIPAFTPTAETLVGDPDARDLSVIALTARLKATAEAVGGVFHRLADGSMVLTIAGMEAAKDRAAAAARFALSLHSLVGDRPIVLATGGSESGVGGIGDTIQRALKRLAGLRRTPEARAPIAIDDVTAALIAAHFDCRDTPGGIELRGERRRTDADRILLGRQVPCIGRERDLQSLGSTFRDVVDESQAHVVLVVAPPGVGKSRLAHEFVRTLRDDDVADVWSAQGDPFRVDVSLALLGDAVRSATGILGGEPLHERHSRLALAVDAALPEAERQGVREFLGELVGAPYPDADSPQLRAARLDAVQMADRLQHAFDAFLAARCRRKPVVLVVEDLHWGDLLSVRILDGALRTADRPFFILALARPEVFERFPGVWSERRLQQIRLAPLSRRAAERLIGVALGRELAPADRDRLIERADGNAFYLEELIRATAEGQHRLPETVVAMAQSRVEALDPPLRRALRAASVFGRVFWASGVHRLIGGGSDDRTTRELLVRLIDGEVVTRRRSSRLPGEDELEFRHALLREGAYTMLTEEDRRLGHQLAAAWLEQRETEARVLAEHHERGGQLAQAVECYVRAAEDAWDNDDGETAHACAARGLELGAAGPARGALLSIAAVMHVRHGRVMESMPMAEEALQLLDAGSPQEVRTIQTLLPALVAQPGRLDTYLQLIHTRGELSGGNVYMTVWLAAWLGLVGRLDEAREQRARLRRLLADTPADPRLRGCVRAAESALHNVMDGRPWQHMLAVREATDDFRATGLVHYQCICGSIYGKALMELGDHTLAEVVQREILALAEASRDAVSVAYARLYLARTLVAVGSDAQVDEALELVREGTAANLEASGHGHTTRAEGLLRRGDRVAAEAEARAGSTCTRPVWAYWWRAVAVHGRILLALGRVDEAVATTREAVDQLFASRMMGSSDIELLHVAAEAHHRGGDVERAHAFLHAALERLRRCCDDVPEAFRRRFLDSVAPNARLLASAVAWLGPAAPALTDLAAGAPTVPRSSRQTPRDTLGA